MVSSCAYKYSDEDGILTRNNMLNYLGELILVLITTTLLKLR